ncbi:LPXTG cell wall anchor domain-containing protein [Alloscardovia theropitheci]|uniref:LPXTG cell wall anchor domain-containing protein n=1 Tax=Alloscardovia theropitheci TaxID=2496842 RepID=A0A4R0QWX5_9BIFI|nr:LPXTG cell wall anchor domain-containing protein [Alloscardovia theropitheci]TCD54977.1 LPXTG cell wall anchor domain-containing protein [Alloscardovia theropitheci]
MNKIIKSGVTALATTAMLTGMAFLMPAVAHAEDGVAPATPAVKSIECPAAPTLTATGSLPQGGEGFDWVRVAGRVFAVAKAGYAFPEGSAQCADYPAATELPKEPEQPTPAPALKEIPVPAAPQATENGTLPEPGEGYTWQYVPQTGQVYAILKPGYKFAGTDDTMVSVGMMKEIVKTQESSQDEHKSDPAQPEADKDAPKDEPVPADATEKVTLSVGEVMPGDKVEVSLSGLDSTKQYTLWLRSTPVRLVDFHAGGRDTFSATITVPANTAAGVHHVVLTERGSTQPLAQAQLVVKAAKMNAVAAKSTKKAGDKLAQTGSDVAAIAGLAMFAILGGAAVALKLRKRH